MTCKRFSSSYLNSIMEPLPISSGQTYRPLAHRNMNVVLLMNNIVTLAPQPRTQARSSRVESDWDFGLALGVMGKAKRKTRLADYNFKMAESNYAKLEEKKKNHLECFSAKGKFTSSSWRTESPVLTFFDTIRSTYPVKKGDVRIPLCSS